MPVIGVPNAGADPDRDLDMSTPISHVLERPDQIWLEHGVVSQPSMVFVAADGSTRLVSRPLGPQGLLAAVHNLRDGDAEA